VVLEQWWQGDTGAPLRFPSRSHVTRLPCVRAGSGSVVGAWVKLTHANGLAAASTQNTTRCRIASPYIYNKYHIRW
jgi:hypothetical protein